QVVRAERPAAGVAVPSEQQDLLDQVARPLRTAADRTQVLRETVVLAEMLLDHFGVAEDPAQDVVEVMRDAAGEGADPLHAARLLQTLLEAPSFPFHRVPSDGVHDDVERHPQQTEFDRISDPPWATDRVETQRNAGAILIDARHAGPCTE